MDPVKTILETQKKLEASFTERFLQLEAALKLASPQQHPSIASVSKDLNNFKAHASDMFQLLWQQILSINTSMDNMEMRHRRKFLQFDGVPEVASENIMESVATICRDSLKLQDITSNSMTVCHRLGARSDGRPRSILVRFSDLQVRNMVWQKKTALKGTSVVISEFLTKQRRATFIAARKHFGMRNVWTLDGNIHLKLPDGKKERITSAEQLQVLTSRYVPVPDSKQPAPKSKSVVPSIPSKEFVAPAQATGSIPARAPSQQASAAVASTSRKPEEGRLKRGT